MNCLSFSSFKDRLTQHRKYCTYIIIGIVLTTFVVIDIKIGNGLNFEPQNCSFLR